MPRLFRPLCRVLAASAVLALVAGAASAEVIYVDVTAAGANNGTSWDDAFSGSQGLVAAINSAVSGDEIWVAAGRYIPGTARTSSFILKNGVAIYGGFSGSETLLSQRNVAANVTILSGDVNNNDSPYPSTTGWAENVYHVVTGTGRNQTAVLDGFTISRGFANGSGTDQERGGGVICTSGNPTFRNLVVINNRVTFGGGAFYLRTASPTITDCRIEANNGGSFGGACDMFTNCNPVWERCLIIGNTAARAGGVEVFGTCQPDFFNCIFANNTSTSSGGGGGMYVASSSNVDIINCTLYANASTAVAGGGVLTSGSNTRVRNTIVWANTGPGGATAGNQLTGSAYTVQYCCVMNGFTGAGNISTNPMLVNPAGRDFHPDFGSPVIDAGRNSDYSSQNLLDFDSAPRFVDDPTTPDTGLGTPPIIDMGALELQGGFVCPTITEQPQGGQVCRNADFTLTVAIDGIAAGYQWRKDGVDIPDATGASYTIQDATNADEGSYVVIVQLTFCPFLQSQPALVVVCRTDTNCDGVINSTDVSEFINQWFTDLAEGTLTSDFDANGVVNSTDVSEFINVWFVESTPQGCSG
jgi:hypothetical protein